MKPKSEINPGVKREGEKKKKKKRSKMQDYVAEAYRIAKSLEPKSVVKSKVKRKEEK